MHHGIEGPAEQAPARPARAQATADCGRCIEAEVRGSCGQWLGSLEPSRGPCDRGFGARERQTLAELLAPIAAALERRSSAPIAQRHVPRPHASQRLLVDRCGRIGHSSPGARRLLMLARGGMTRERLDMPLDLLAGPLLAGLQRPMPWPRVADPPARVDRRHRPPAAPARRPGGRPDYAAAMNTLRSAILALAMPLALALPAAARELDGTMTLTAHTRDGQRIALGSVRFEPAESGRRRFVLTIDPAPFRDHFLSMKEFKCLEGPGELACHVPYPYPSPRTVADGDFAWLEHELLFLYKLPREFGAKLWNGLYYRMERTERGLRGRPQAIDLNAISAPPERPAVPPYRPALRDDIPAGARWIESLTIE